ncbi:hypothetical protein D1614_22945 [Maribellus luteus]|uniref:Lipocalin-like domain-containing protein n=1 Tax=Maribellus luteus TaxID=2305463 RepID=A0A399SRC9_9BACT|nr:hypothetical protein [Maribellus luteus]RIJ45449.1 hypothetical protein D1614_22945 [Maribellus luteus]
MKSKELKLLTFFLLLLPLYIVFGTGCEKEDIEHLPPPDENGIILLRDVKSLSLIKNTIQGKWKMHYAYGGFTGHGRIDLTDSWFQFLPNDSMYVVFEGDTYAATQTEFVRKQTEFGFDAWILDFEFINDLGLKDEFVIDMLKEDTLVLPRNSVDSYAYLMTKEL